MHLLLRHAATASAAHVKTSYQVGQGMEATLVSPLILHEHRGDAGMTANLCKRWALYVAITHMIMYGSGVGGPRPAFAADQPTRSVPSSNPLSGDAEAIAQGRRLYTKWCMQCHGRKADGRSTRFGLYAKDLRKFWRGYSAFFAIVVSGRPKKKMPAWAGIIQPEEIQQIGAYLETLAIEGANWQDN
jgi:mono/diheme cytochrome c family protein